METRSRLWRHVAMGAVIAAGMGMTNGAWGDVSANNLSGAGVVGSSAPAKSTEDLAKAEWARLSMQIKNEDDLATIVGIHGRFLEQYPESKLAETVETSKQVYEALLKSKALKFRGKWVPAEQVEVLQKQWREDVKPALDLYRAGKWRE